MPCNTSQKLDNNRSLVPSPAPQMALKRPNAISFSKKNVIRPFEDPSSLSFWAQKNDASLFVLGQSTKKRPDGLVFARMFDGDLLDMCEVGVDEFVSMDRFKVSTCIYRSLFCSY